MCCIHALYFLFAVTPFLWMLHISCLNSLVPASVLIFIINHYSGCSICWWCRHFCNWNEGNCPDPFCWAGIFLWPILFLNSTCFFHEHYAGSLCWERMVYSLLLCDSSYVSNLVDIYAVEAKLLSALALFMPVQLHKMVVVSKWMFYTSLDSSVIWCFIE
jgi:hypothetical protein